MLPTNVQDAINKQINMELSSAYSYLAMSAYCELNNFVGCAKWMQLQGQGEHVHAMKLYNFLIARGCEVTFAEIPAAPSRFESIPHQPWLSLDGE